MKPNKTTTEWRDMINGLEVPEPAKLVLRQIITQAIYSAKQEEVQRIIELAEKMKSKDYHSPNFLTRITQGEMEDHLLINDLITTLKDYGK